MSNKRRGCPIKKERPEGRPYFSIHGFLSKKVPISQQTAIAIMMPKIQLIAYYPLVANGPAVERPNTCAS